MAGKAIAYWKKTAYYLKRNGVKKTWYAVRERLAARGTCPYQPPMLSADTWEKQREESASWDITFSVLVPAYRTGETYLREMIDSLIGQSFPHWELVLADATEDDSVKDVVTTFEEPRIRYVKLEHNAGISENTNQGLQHVTGEYVGLLDHDDVLTPDALYEMAKAIGEERDRGVQLQMLYSDEDKCNADMSEFYEPNFKEDFNPDMLLSNNYICHFLVMKKELMQSLQFRAAYDGAQDFDLVLRAMAELYDRQDRIYHIPKVLYRWRCHQDSTAENPRSKLYAYEAGRRAIQDYADQRGWQAYVEETAHLGFYRLVYENGIFANRERVGAVGGPVIACGKIRGGRMDAEGNVYYRGTPKNYSGYLHRTILSQTAVAVDIRRMQVREECRQLFEQVVGVPYVTLQGTEMFDSSTLAAGSDYVALSLAFCQALSAEGYEIVYMP